MGLDFVVAKDRERRVTLERDEHDALLAVLHETSMLQRVSDYWGDAEFAPDELRDLDVELATIQSALESASPLQPFLMALRWLINGAASHESSILAEAD